MRTTVKHSQQMKLLLELLLSEKKRDIICRSRVCVYCTRKQDFCLGALRRHDTYVSTSEYNVKSRFISGEGDGS